MLQSPARPVRRSVMAGLLAMSFAATGAATAATPGRRSADEEVKLQCMLLVHELADAYSSRDADRGAALFTDDGVWVVDGATFKGTEALRARLARLPPALAIMVTTTTATPVDATTAKGVTYALAMNADRPREDTKPHGTYDPIPFNGFSTLLIYRDTFKLTKDGWKVAYRTTNRVFNGPGQKK